MGEFRRQPSKVWWSTFTDGIPDSPNWGKGVDLSGNAVRESSLSGPHFAGNASDPEEDVAARGVAMQSVNQSSHEEEAPSGAEKFDWEESKINGNWQGSDVSNDRGCSSSPSQGSHKSQDSGFSDSEIHSHPALPSPQDSPDLSKRRECSQYVAAEGARSAPSPTESYLKGNSSNLINHFQNLHLDDALTVVRASPRYTKEESGQNKYLETAFDEPTPNRSKVHFIRKCEDTRNPSQSVNTRVPSASSHSIFTKIQKGRTKNSDKINKIQNQFELSFKFPSPRRTSPLSNANACKLLEAEIPVKTKSTDLSGREGEDESDISVSSGRVTPIQNFSSNHTVIQLPKKPEKVTAERCESDTDGDGFKIPKTLADQNVNYKGSDNFLNLTHIDGTPVSSSTPKSVKLKRQESPIPKAARAIEKKIGNMSTFATIRKLKGISDKKIRRPISLFPSFNRSRMRDGPLRKRKATAEQVGHSSIRQWLTELGTMYEAEIMTTLQSKSLATDLTRQVTSMAATTSETVRRLHHKTRMISAEFSRVFQHKKNKKYKQIPPIVQSLIGHIKEFIEDYVQNEELIPKEADGRADEDGNTEGGQKHEKTKEEVHEMVTDFRLEEPKTEEISAESESHWRPGLRQELGANVVEACEELRLVADADPLDQNAVERNLTVLGEKFTKVVDTILLTHVKALVRTLEEPKTELALRTALSALTSLDLEGTVLSHLVARSEGVRALLAVCLEARATAVRTMALRALTVVCSIAETVRQFEQAGGLEIIADILSDDNRAEAELSEAVAVLAQITAPWIKDNHSFQTLSQFLGDLVKSLTRVVKNCKSSETLLLSAAALANLTFMEPRTVWPLLENQTAQVLLSAVRRQGPKVSVFIQEQAATVIANMASVPECRKHLADNRAVVALLCFLQIRHSPFQRVPEIAAAERVQQKSAIALSRLCSDSVVAKQVVELQGVNRLVHLCKEERERNHSDGVLVACLAALRKVVANCGTEALENLEAMELVEPRLLDSFLLYSSKQESYV